MLPLLNVVWLACAGSAFGLERGRIVVPHEVVVSEDPVRLRDIAVLEGDAAAGLGDVEVAAAPEAGETRTVDGARLLETLRRAGLDPAIVTYTMPSLLRIRRATQEITAASVRGIVETFLRDELGAGAEDAVLRTVDVQGPVRIPTGVFTTRVRTPSNAPLLGRVRLGVEFVMNDHMVKTTWVTADVARFGPVVVTTRALARGETVRADDVTVDRRDLSQVPRNVVTDLEDAVGMVARSALLPYAAVRREQVGAATLVRRGDAVLLVAERRGLRISAAGEARQDGARGEAVAVLNRSTGKTLVGRVMTGGTVVVEF